MFCWIVTVVHQLTLVVYQDQLLFNSHFTFIPSQKQSWFYNQILPPSTQVVLKAIKEDKDITVVERPFHKVVVLGQKRICTSIGNI